MKNYWIKSIAGIFVLGLLMGCAMSPPMTSELNLTPEEEAYLEKAKLFPLEFTMPKSEEDEVWGRAQSFIGRFSSMKLQIVTDFVIQTYNPRDTDVDFGYYVTKTPMGDKIKINVQCNTGNRFVQD